MYGAASEKRVVFNLLETIRGVGALLITGRDVAGDRLAFSASFCALEDNKIAGHWNVWLTNLLFGIWDVVLFFSLLGFLIG